MKIRPLHDRVLIKRLEEEKSTASGLIIPDSATEKPLKGGIIAVGSGKRDNNGALVPLDVKVGNIVLFAQFAGTEIKVNDEDLLIMREDEITAVVEK